MKNKIYKDKLGQEFIITPEMQVFGDAAKAYKDKFGVKYPCFIGADNVTTEQLKEAVKFGKEIQPPIIPAGSLS